MFDDRRMAKDPKQEQKPAPAPEIPPEPVRPPKSYRMLAMIAFVNLVLFQAILLFLLLPTKSPYDISKQQIDNTKPPDVAPSQPIVERPINEGKPITVKNVQGDSSVTFKVKVDVAVLIVDSSKFDKQYLARTAQIIDRASGILRATTSEERQEAGLTTIKEKLKRGFNEALGTPWVQYVYCSGVELDVQ